MSVVLKLYAQILAAIDDRIQLEESSLAFVHSVNAPMELELTYCVPMDGFEFDPKAHVGTARIFDVAVYRVKATGPRPDYDRAASSLAESGSLALAVGFKAKAVGWRLAGSCNETARAIVTFREEPTESPE